MLAADADTEDYAADIYFRHEPDTAICRRYFAAISQMPPPRRYAADWLDC